MRPVWTVQFTHIIDERNLSFINAQGKSSDTRKLR